MGLLFSMPVESLVMMFVQPYFKKHLGFSLNDNATHLQLSWIVTAQSPAWFIDEIFIDCYPFSVTMVFEELDW